MVRKIPSVRKEINAAIAESKADLRKDVLKTYPGEVVRTELPVKGLGPDEVCLVYILWPCLFLGGFSVVLLCA